MAIVYGEGERLGGGEGEGSGRTSFVYVGIESPLCRYLPAVCMARVSVYLFVGLLPWNPGAGCALQGCEHVSFFVICTVV